MAETISVVTARVEPTKGIFAADAVLTRVDIPLDQLKTNIADLTVKLRAIASGMASDAQPWPLSELEVGIEITAEGGVSLIGIAKAGATASLKLTFKRE